MNLSTQPDRKDGDAARPADHYDVDATAAPAAQRTTNNGAVLAIIVVLIVVVTMLVVSRFRGPTEASASPAGPSLIERPFAPAVRPLR